MLYNGVFPTSNLLRLRLVWVAKMLPLFHENEWLDQHCSPQTLAQVLLLSHGINTWNKKFAATKFKNGLATWNCQVKFIAVSPTALFHLAWHRSNCRNAMARHCEKARVPSESCVTEKMRHLIFVVSCFWPFVLPWFNWKLCDAIQQPLS